MHPLAGTWIANLSKSHRHTNHQFHSATMRFAVTGQEVSLSYEGINHEGRPESNTHVLHADGEEHAIAAAPGFVAVSTLGVRWVESVGKKDGAVVGRGRYEVSDDGQTMTATVAGIDASGKPFEQVIAFDRLIENC